MEIKEVNKTDLLKSLKKYKKEFIQDFNVADLVPYDNNPRIHNKDQVEELKESILDCGDNDPIEIDENNVILCGHGRRIALMELGLQKTDVIKYFGMTDRDKKRYRVWANKTGEKSLWDTLKLGIDFTADELKELGFDYFKDKKDSQNVNGALPIDIEVNRESNFILVAIDNETDFVFLQQKFNLKDIVNPKNRKIGVARVITYNQLKEHLK